jgi:hypothetical protein
MFSERPDQERFIARPSGAIGNEAWVRSMNRDRSAIRQDRWAMNRDPSAMG